LGSPFYQKGGDYKSALLIFKSIKNGALLILK